MWPSGLDKRRILLKMYPGESWKNRVMHMSQHQVDNIWENKVHGGNMPQLIHGVEMQINEISSTSKREELRTRLNQATQYYEVAVIWAETAEYKNMEVKYCVKR